MAQSKRNYELERLDMIRFLASAMLPAIMCMGIAAGADKKPGKRAPAAKTTTFTGCIDQRGANYVLTGDKELHTVAVLHGDGFEDDNFAREMGHKVTIEGALAGDADPKTI